MNPTTFGAKVYTGQNVFNAYSKVDDFDDGNKRLNTDKPDQLLAELNELIAPLSEDTVYFIEKEEAPNHPSSNDEAKAKHPRGFMLIGQNTKTPSISPKLMMNLGDTPNEFMRVIQESIVHFIKIANTEKVKLDVSNENNSLVKMFKTPIENEYTF